MLRPVTYALLYAEAFDFLTTGIALTIGCIELNPLVNAIGWIPVIIMKITIVLGIAWFLELKSRKRVKALWIYPIVAAIPVVWNTFVIITRISHL
jgi:hypothetical protein